MGEYIRTFPTPIFGNDYYHYMYSPYFLIVVPVEIQDI